MVGYGSFIGRSWNCRRKVILNQGTVALAALFAFLVIRNTPPHFLPQPSLHQSSIYSVFSHGHKPHFDSDRFQWSAPGKAFVPFPLAAESSYSSPASQVLSALQTEGFRYNRPPPTI
jgi:hypothetical protein